MWEADRTKFSSADFGKSMRYDQKFGFLVLFFVSLRLQLSLLRAKNFRRERIDSELIQGENRLYRFSSIFHADDNFFLGDEGLYGQSDVSRPDYIQISEWSLCI